MKPKYRWIETLAIIIALFLILNTRIEALGTWTEGVVSQKAWTEKYDRIEVNEIKYMLMPDAKVYLSYKTKSGAYNETPISVRDIRKGQKVMMLALGHNVYQLIAFK